VTNKKYVRTSRYSGQHCLFSCLKHSLSVVYPTPNVSTKSSVAFFQSLLENSGLFFTTCHERFFCRSFQFTVHNHGIIVHIRPKKKAVPLHALGERRYSYYSFTTSALDGGEWSASRPGRAFTPGERTPGTHCTEGWVGPRAGLDTEDTGKIFRLCRGSNPDRPVVQPVVRHYTA
jgi:hypothetical protein